MIKKVLQVIGFFLGYMFLLVGAFFCIDAFIPKSEPVSLRFLLEEFGIGAATIIVGYILIRCLRKLGAGKPQEDPGKNGAGC